MVLHPCVCNVGCPGRTYSTFASGHDAIYRERMIGLLRVKLLSVGEVRHLAGDMLGMPKLAGQIIVAAGQP
jgi:hypothetical protein